MNRPTERMVIVAQGLLGENEEFLAYRWSLPSESTKALAPSDQALPAFFKLAGTPAPAPAAPAPVPTSTTTGAPASVPSTTAPSTAPSTP